MQLLESIIQLSTMSEINIVYLMNLKENLKEKFSFFSDFYCQKNNKKKAKILRDYNLNIISIVTYNCHKYKYLNKTYKFLFKF